MATGTMVCLYCRKKIGLLRSLQDRNFCCASHRKQQNSKSARALREAEDQFGFETQVSWRMVTEVKAEDKTDRRASYGGAVFLVLAVAIVLLALTRFPVAAPAARAVSPLPSTNLHPDSGGFGRMIGNLIGTTQSGVLHEDFRSGFGNWEGLRSTGAEWTRSSSDVRPTSLRLWKPSSSLSNYELEFMGQIDRKSIDWAFRAADLHNYYATKLVIAKPGSLPNAGLIRYVVLDGRERESVELPLPLALERGVDYRVRVSVRGNHFLTSVNGQLVSSWTDNLLSRGGVGFFSDNGESALLKWVTLSERDSVLARIASHFSLIAVPTIPMAGEP